MPSTPEPQILVIAAQHRGVRLQDYLEGHWSGVDRAFLRRLVLNGDVAVNGEVVGLRYRLRGGDVVEVALPNAPDRLPRFATPEPVDEVSVLHEDEGCLVVDKPAGVAAGPDRAGREPGVLGRVGRQRPDVDLRILHRQDRETSGCLILAKGSAAASRLEAAFHAGDLAEEYAALVYGRVRWRDHSACRHLGPDPHRPGRVRVVDAMGRGARPARTDLRREEVFRDHTLVRAWPLTWRGHQVRVHLASLGHPVVADREYGVRPRLLLSEIKKNYKARRGVEEQPLLARMFLHVERVRLPATDGAPIEVVAPLPKQLEVVRNKLRSFAAIRQE